ncbi:MAG: glycosyltransferase [Acidiferrobacterales bacterium]|nr:glycosyltransferase [Acidiferrobacterales bacterium]
MTTPRISIVTVCLNNESVIEDAIRSVAKQDVSGVDHVIIDGGSTDRTLDILANFPHLRVFSHPDDGVYDAVNKGIAKAEGEIIGIVHGDDRLPAGALAHVLDGFERQRVDMLTGSVAYINATGLEIARYPVGNREMTPMSILLGIPMVNARFFRHRVFEVLAPFRTNLGLAADREFLLRALQSDLKRACIVDTVYEYRCHYGSSTINPTFATRLNLWALHVALAERLLFNETWDERVRDALRALYQVERLKLTLHGKQWRAKEPVTRKRNYTSWAWTELPRHLWAWHRERDRHCGF